ncbi:MAG: AAA family ATPase [Lettuce witches'-broom phytoplasma]
MAEQSEYMYEKIRELNKVKEQLSLANKKNFFNEQEKKQLIERIDQLIQNIKEQENILSSKQKEIFDLQREKTTIEQSLTEQLYAIQSQQNLQKEEKQNLLGFIENQKNLLADNQTKLDEIQEQLISTRTTIKRLNLLMQEQQNNLDKHKEDIISLKEQIFNQKNDINAKDELIKQKIQELETKQEQLTQGEKENTLLEEEKNSLTNEIKDLINDINNQRETLLQKETFIEELQRDKTNLENILSSKEKEIESNKILSQKEKQSLLGFIENQKNLLADNQRELNETKDKLESSQKEIEKLKKNIQYYQKQLDKHKKDIISLKEQIFNQKNDINAKDELIKQKIQELETKQEQLTQGEKENTLLEEEKNSLTNEIKDLINDINNQRETLLQKETFIEELQRDKTNLENILSSKEKEIESNKILSQKEKQSLLGFIENQKNLLADNQRELNETKDKLESSQKEIEKLKKNIQYYQKQLDKHKKDIISLKEQIFNQKNDINAKDELIKQKIQELETKQEQLTQGEKENTLLKEEKNSLTNEIKDLINDINNQRETLLQKETFIEELQRDKTNLENILSSKEKEIESNKILSQKEKQSLLGFIENQKNLLADNQRELNETKDKLESSQKEIEKLKKNIQYYQKQLNKHKEDIISLKEQIFNQKNDINAKDELIKQKIQELETKQEQLTQGEKENTLLKEEKNSLTNEIKDLINDINNQRETLLQKETFIEELQRDKTNLENILSSKEKEIESNKILSQKEKQSLLGFIENQKNLLADNQRELNETKDKLESSQKETEKLKKNIQYYQKQLDKHKEDIVSLKEQIFNQKNDINAKDELIKQKIQELETKQEQLTQGEKENTLLEEEKNSLTNEIKDLISDIENKKKELNQLEKSIQKLQTDKNNLEESLSLKETEIQNLQTLSQKEKHYLQTNINNQKKLLSDNQKQLDKTKEQLRNAHFNIKEQEKKLEIYDKLMNFFKEFHDNSLDTLGTLIDKTQKQQEKSDQLNAAKYLETFELIKKELKDVAKERMQLKQTETTTSRFLKDTSSFHGFKDVIGMEKEKEQLLESLSYLKNPEEYKKMGVKKPPRGVLLYGPPGTGKTYLAQAFAKESGLPFYAVTSADFSRSYVGEGPRIIENLFEEARKHSPCIIFIDECESIFRKRNIDGLTSDHGNMISSFLSQIEGIYTDPDKTVFIIAATNFKDEIDIAILSRFNKLIEIDYWKEEELKTFVKMISKNYKLDVRAYKYLEKIMEQICKFDNHFLKSPRKIIEILDQAAGIAIEIHRHLNILPIDLQLSFDRISQSETLVDWEKHTHDKPDMAFLSTMKEYKNISLKHLFKDSPFSFSEKKYFDLINNHYQKHQKAGYNKYLNNEIDSITFSDDKEKIKKTYNDENPLPEGLLGVYFEDKENTDSTKRRSEIQKIDSLEEILKTGMKKVHQIYLIWDYEKLKINQQTAHMLIDKFYYKYPFLRGDAFFQAQILQKAREIDNNEAEIEQFILKFLDENIKQPLINNVFSQIVAQNLLIEENDKLEIKKIIADKLDFLIVSPYISTLEKLQFALLSETKTYLEVNKQQILEQQIDRIIEELKLNNMLFTSQQIKHFQIDLKKEVYNELVNLMKRKNNISLDEVKVNIKDNSALLIDRLFYQTWQTIYPKLHIEIVEYEKNSLITFLQNKLKKNLFFTNFSLEEIVDLLQQEINTYENNFEERLKEKVSETVHKYILIDHILEEQPNTETIELISKGAFLVAQKESQRPDVTENKIQQEIYDFIKNYRIKNTHSSEIYAWIKHNFYIILLTLMMLYVLINSANKNQKRRY